MMIDASSFSNTTSSPFCPVNGFAFNDNSNMFANHSQYPSNDFSFPSQDICALPSVERRKIMKPILEKKRRDRINKSLAELKQLILALNDKDESYGVKMEKADILEMTSSYLKNLRTKLWEQKSKIVNLSQRSQQVGYTECAAEVMQFLSANCKDNLQIHEAKAKLSDYLSQNIQHLNKPISKPKSQESAQLAPFSSEKRHFALPSSTTPSLESGIFSLTSSFDATNHSTCSSTYSSSPPSPSSSSLSSSPDTYNDHNLNSSSIPAKKIKSSTPKSSSDSKLWRPW